ncbi:MULTISPECIES: helix-turn-helix transcriptional regulator [Pseudomonas]|uniref:Helix-turn-helix transcriptional regulator n=1 Tax=Pseudomonas eucalypticola TaxID=2599595 RepID=A0A7D5H6U1_9PSED|nr:MULTISPECIES: AraC family transcriptional regulator [Pseudomonas]QKZ05403.1 helix-turn-helix transcriptional regulator [Pseudomonas eucalypticola]
MHAAVSRRPFIIRSDHMGGEAFGSLFSRVFGNLYNDLPRTGSPVSIAGVYGRYEGVSFRRLCYRGDFTVQIPDLDDEITFVIPTAGQIIFNLADATVGRPQVGLAVEKTQVRSVQIIDGHGQHGLSIRRGLFTQRLSTLLGRPIVRKIRFEPQVDLSREAFQGIKAIVAFATGDELDTLMNSSALMPTRLQEMLVDAVLESWPHSYSEALRRPGPSIAPRHVRLAMEYIQEHPHCLVSSTELAALSHVSLRALQDGFRRFMGTSIAAYQRQVRLARAYEAFRQGAAASVTEVALQLGFSNVGRFCHYFQNAYGLSPQDVRNGLRSAGQNW